MNTEPVEVNKASVNSQNAQLAAFILSGKQWHCKMSAERKKMGIGYSAMRIGALRKLGITFDQVSKKMTNENGNTTQVVVYSISPERIPLIKEHLQRTHKRFYGQVAHWLGE